MQRQRAPRALDVLHATLRRKGLPADRAQQAAEEGVQEACVRAFKESFADEEHLFRWLIRVAHNFLHETWRKDRRRQELPDDGRRVEAAPRSLLAPFVELLFEEIDELPLRDRWLILRIYWHGCKRVNVARRWIAAGDKRTETTLITLITKRLDGILSRLAYNLPRLADERDVEVGVDSPEKPTDGEVEGE